MARVIRSSAITLAIGYILLALVALVLFAAPLRYAWQATIEDFRVELLQEDSQRLARVFELRGPAGLARFIDDRVAMQIAGERILLFTDVAGHRLAGNQPAWPQNIPTRAGSYTLPFPLHGRSKMVVMVLTTLPGGYRLLVGRDVARFAPIERRFWYGLAAAIAVLTAAGLIGAVLIRSALLARIHGIQLTVAAIMRGDLSHRLKVRSSGDELDTLAQTINRLLEQVEQLVHGIANVSNSIAHDLRTPLAELRSRLEEIALTRPPTEEAFAEIDAAVADVDGVIRIFNALLRLAEIDAGLRRSNFVQADVADLLARAVEFYLPAAELKGLSLALHDAAPVWARCDPVLLAQAINNLIDNSLKFVAPGGHIQVSVEVFSAERIAVVVADDGPGIPDADRPRATERFFRGDTSRATPGVGLGLSLVEAIARVHGGSLELTDNHPGLLAQMLIERGAAGTPEQQHSDLAGQEHDAEITA
ncbi:MAG TPA: HAMP domain-containing sensor histidine kinase [Steroidobacteraceae bacterium]|nr:HAMP domain-containing sensor histidine kinase [Steroidobacteraceae bacterium]